MNAKDRATARALYRLTKPLGKKAAAEAIDAFVSLLVKHGRLARAPKILEALESVAVEEEGGVEVELASASDVSDASAAKFADGLSDALGKPVVLRRRTDPSLIGGAVLRAGELRVDGSVRTKLRKLARTLID